LIFRAETRGFFSAMRTARTRRVYITLFGSVSVRLVWVVSPTSPGIIHRWRIHRQIEYKAALEGVPVLKIDPKYTSKTCPVCGARRRDRVGKVFECPCGWRMDRQLNAGLNILRTALASNEALARAVRFQPGALRDDAMSPLYDLPGLLGGAREEPNGVELGASKIA